MPGRRTESMRWPAKPISAGRRVSDPAAMIATVMAHIRPMLVTSGMPAMARPMMAITTVMPAKSTAEPDVAMARPAASSTDCPCVRCSRWRVTMNSA
jgi:hypothetical protein